MKNRKKNHFKLWTIGILTILLLTTPTLYADDVWISGTEDIDGPITGNLYIMALGTANLQTGASVGESIYVLNGGTLNMYSGTIGTKSDYLCFICVSPNAAGMTVYGTEFAVTTGTIDPDGNWTPVGGMGTLKGKYEDESEIDLCILSDNPIKLVNIENNNDENIEIDIKPGSDENVINLKSKGVVPVAVLTTDEFYAGDLVPDYSISFAGASPVHSTLCDVDEDGDEDMLFHFRTQELNLDETSTEAELTGTLKSAVTRSSSVSAADGDVIYGTDKVKIKSSKKK